MGRSAFEGRRLQTSLAVRPSVLRASSLSTRPPPRVQPDARGRASLKHAGPPFGARGIPTTKVLLVDDEPGILRSTELLLHELGFETVSTTRPAEILSTLRRERPDVLLQDVRMPELDIDSLLVRIREDPVVGLTPVLLFSASMDLDEVQDRVGAQGYLEKPFKPDEVVRAIQRVVRR